jgi:hypothetical protein
MYNFIIFNASDILHKKKWKFSPTCSLLMYLHKCKQESETWDSWVYKSDNCLILVVVGHGDDYSYDCGEN